MKINELNREYQLLAALSGIEFEFRKPYQKIIEYSKNRKILGTPLATAPNLTPLLINRFNLIADKFINWLPADPKLNKDKALVKKLKYKLSILN